MERPVDIVLNQILEIFGCANFFYYGSSVLDNEFLFFTTISKLQKILSSETNYCHLTFWQNPKKLSFP